LRERLRYLEMELEGLHTRRQGLEAELGRPALYEEGAKAELLRLLDEQGVLGQEVARVEAAWLEVSEALEQPDED
jgi:ATP-binding cassette subfamily F protein 3